MDISNINGISTGDIKSFFNNTSLTKTDRTDSFSDVLSAAMGSIGETNDLQNAAEQEEVRFALASLIIHMICLLRKQRRLWHCSTLLLSGIK